MLWIALVIVEVMVWWGVLAVGWKRAAVGDRVLGAFVLTTAQNCMIGYFLGSIGLFDPAFVVCYHVLLIVWVHLISDKYGCVWTAWWSDVWVVGHWVRIAMRKPLVAAMTAISAVAVGLVVYYGLHMPPMAYDGWGYHLPKAVLLAKTGWIQPWWWDESVGAYVPGFRGYEDLTRRGGHLAWMTFFYPANGPVLMAYPLAFGFGLRVAGLTQVLFAGMMALSVYRIVRRVVGAGVEWSAVCALGVFGLWTVLGQMWYALGDVMSAGLLWAGYSLVMVPWRGFIVDSTGKTMLEKDIEIIIKEKKRLIYGANDKSLYMKNILATIEWWEQQLNHIDKYNHNNYWPFILSGLAAGLAFSTKLGAGYWALGIMCLAIYKVVKR